MTRNAAFALCLLAGSTTLAADQPPSPPATRDVAVRVTGLFSPDRIDDLKKAVAELDGITLANVDFPTSEATFRFDPALAFPGAKPSEIVGQLDNRLRSVSRQTLGVREPCPVPREKLKYVEIPILGLDCKGCALGAYDAVYRIEGVEQATADFKKGLVTAWIDPAKVDSAKLAAALRSRGVTLKQP